MRFWKAIWAIEWWMAAVGAGLMLFIMMMVTVVSVAGRYFLQMDLIPGAYNIVERIIFPLLVFWALPIAHREGMFPRLETFADAQPPRRRAFIAAFAMLVELVIYVIFFWFVFRFVWSSIQQNRTMQIGTSFLPLWPILVMMPLAFGLMILEMGRLFYRYVRQALGLDSVDEVQTIQGSAVV